MRTLFLLCALALSAERRAPIDVDQLNDFAGKYNRYIQQVHGGIVDVKQWEKVRRAWRAMESE